MDECIEIIIKRFLEHKISRQEVRQLEDWLKDHGNRIIFKEFAIEWQKQTSGLPEYDPQIAYDRLNVIVSQKLKHRSMRLFLKYTAVVMLLIASAGMATYYMHESRFQPNNLMDLTNMTLIRPMKGDVVLTLSSGELFYLSGNDKELSSSDSVFWNDDVHSPIQITTGQSCNILSTPSGKDFRITLSDGTKVWLNNNSCLKYPPVFEGKERVVYLEGEAFFDVVHNEDVKFLIKTADLTFEVLGTSFNIRTHREEGMPTATLVTGSMAIHNNNKATNGKEKPVILEPGNQAVLTKDNEILVSNVDTFVYTAWHDGKFYFNNELLIEVIKELSKWYDFQYSFSDEMLKNERIVCIVNKYDNFRSIIEMIRATRCADFLYENGKLKVLPYPGRDKMN